MLTTRTADYVEWSMVEGTQPPVYEISISNNKRTTGTLCLNEKMHLDAIDGHLEHFHNIADRALEWSSKKPYLQNLFAGWLEGNDMDSQNDLIREEKRKWWTMTQSADMVRKELSCAVFGAVAISMNAATNSGWSAEKLREPTFPLTILLQHGADPLALSDPGEDGGTALHWLADMTRHEDEENEELRERQVELARILLDHGADVNARLGSDQCTPLHKACSSRAGANTKFIDLLLEYGADVNALTKDGWTFFMYSLPLNLTAAWHVFDTASDKLYCKVFVREIEEALVKERVEYLKEKYELNEESTSIMIAIVKDIRDELKRRGREKASPKAEVASV